MVWANPPVSFVSPKLVKPPFVSTTNKVTHGQSAKPLTVGCVCTPVVLLSLSSLSGMLIAIELFCLAIHLSLVKHADFTLFSRWRHMLPMRTPSIFLGLTWG